MAYTKDDNMFKGIDKRGAGIITTAKLEQAKVPDAENARWRLLDAIDIDWNNAELPYTYAATQTYINDTSDLLSLIDEISHGNSISWETYPGENYDDNPVAQETGSDNQDDGTGEFNPADPPIPGA